MATTLLPNWRGNSIHAEHLMASWLMQEGKQFNIDYFTRLLFFLISVTVRLIHTAPTKVLVLLDWCVNPVGVCCDSVKNTVMFSKDNVFCHLMARSERSCVFPYNQKSILGSLKLKSQALFRSYQPATYFQSIQHLFFCTKKASSFLPKRLYLVARHKRFVNKKWAVNRKTQYACGQFCHVKKDICIF